MEQSTDIILGGTKNTNPSSLGKRPITCNFSQHGIHLPTSFNDDLSCPHAKKNLSYQSFTPDIKMHASPIFALPERIQRRKTYNHILDALTPKSRPAKGTVRLANPYKPTNQPTNQPSTEEGDEKKHAMLNATSLP